MGTKHKAVWAGSVEFGSVSIGDVTAAIGVTMLLDRLDGPQQAFDLFVAKILDCVLEIGTFDPDTQMFDKSVSLEAQAESKGVRLTLDKVAARLVVALGTVEVEQFCRLSQQDGYLTILAVDDIPEEDSEAGSE